MHLYIALKWAKFKPELIYVKSSGKEQFSNEDVHVFY